MTHVSGRDTFVAVAFLVVGLGVGFVLSERGRGDADASRDDAARREHAGQDLKALTGEIVVLQRDVIQLQTALREAGDAVKATSRAAHDAVSTPPTREVAVAGATATPTPEPPPLPTTPPVMNAQRRQSAFAALDSVPERERHRIHMLQPLAHIIARYGSPDSAAPQDGGGLRLYYVEGNRNWSFLLVNGLVVSAMRA